MEKSRDEYLSKYNQKKKELVEYVQRFSEKVAELDKQDEIYKSNMENVTEQTNHLLSMRRTQFINDSESMSQFH